jgi:hypothetical protein
MVMMLREIFSVINGQPRTFRKKNGIKMPIEMETLAGSVMSYGDTR